VVPGEWTFVAMRQDNLTGNLTLDVDARREITKSFFGLGLPRVRIGGGPAHNVGSMENQKISVFIDVFSMMIASQTSGLGERLRFCQ
jgi:hypothetical protein